MTGTMRTHFKIGEDRVACMKVGVNASGSGIQKMSIDPHKVNCKICRGQPIFLVAYSKAPPPPPKRSVDYGDAIRYRFLRKTLLPFVVPGQATDPGKNGPEMLYTTEEFDEWVNMHLLPTPEKGKDDGEEKGERGTIDRPDQGTHR